MTDLTPEKIQGDAGETRIMCSSCGGLHRTGSLRPIPGSPFATTHCVACRMTANWKEECAHIHERLAAVRKERDALRARLAEYETKRKVGDGFPLEPCWLLLWPSDGDYAMSGHWDGELVHWTDINCCTPEEISTWTYTRLPVAAGQEASR